MTKLFIDGEVNKNDKKSGKESQMEEHMLTEVLYDITVDAERLKYTHARFSVYGAPLNKAYITSYWNDQKRKKDS